MSATGLATQRTRFVLPSYVVADVFATYETKYQTLPVIYQLNVKNLFDTVYFPSAVNNLNVAMGDARGVAVGDREVLRRTCEDGPPACGEAGLSS